MSALSAYWVWIAGGAVLVLVEIALPGVFMFWIGLAAIATGLLLWALPLPVAGQMIAFALFGAAAIVAGLAVQRRQKGEATDAPFLHDRGHALIGKVLTLETAISDGVGAAKVGDSVWRVKGPDRPAGEKVRVVGLEGATLVVEPA